MKLGASAALSVTQSVLLLPVAWLIKVSFDRILAGAGLVSLLVPCGAIVLLTVVSLLAALFARHLSLDVTKRVVSDLRMELSTRAYLLAGTFATVTDRSALQSVIVQDTERVDVGSNALVAIALPAVITGLLFTVALAILAPPLLLIPIVLAPLSLLANRLLGRRLRRLVTRFRETFDGFAGNTNAFLRRMELTRLRGAEALELDEQSGRIEELRSASAHMAWTATAYSALQSLHVTIISVVTLVVGGTLVATGWMSMGALAAFCFVLAQLGASARAVWGATPQVLTGLDALANIAAMQARERQTPDGGDIEHEVRGAVAFRGVDVAYDRPLLSDVNLAIAAGERVALIGDNGSGKTTLLHLLLGLYRPERGTILVDDVPLDGIALDHYRRQIGVVLQDPLVFAGTIFSNIAYGHPAATLSDVTYAAELAGAARFINALPKGYQSVIGRDGAALSGGQSQLLAIARALIGGPKILLLDEPTNHLDRSAVKRLLDNLETMPARPTVVIATHDRGLAAAMSRVYAVRDGRVVPAADRDGLRAVAV
jgi:ABC-type bacteriocin/lantibiotic exporter with double-glycine peptidase domain